MRRNWRSWRWQLGIVSSLATIGAIALYNNRISAQVVPDRTLGRESSVVNRIDRLRDRIDGGATRGENLFHSFQEFNVGEGRGVYFANPEGITNILSRVTGGNPSHILGRLGVLGGANLFLLNPNGILFGANSSLDISGSFVATTADGIQLGENGFFSATEPEKSRLLSVSPGVAFFEQAANTPGVIVNRGNLAVGKDLTFSAENLDLQGQLVAGGNLTLQALDTVQIRDSKLNPFVAAAKGDLLVRGNQKVDIFALNHPASGLFSGRDLVLRSANTVGGDAHFWSGGNFRIEKMDGNLGDLSSPRDPIIRSLGDVSFNIYRGASLHILAGGAVNIGTVIITGADVGTEGVDFLQETVQLSNGTTISINGGTQPTVDIRAGIKPDKIGSAGITGFDSFTDSFINNFFLPDTPNLTASPISADITIGDIFIDPPNGLVYITNQYEANPSLPTGNITITGLGLFQREGITGNGIDARGFGGNGSSVILDSRNNITLADSFIDSSSSSGNAGDITLIANQGISLTDGAFIGSSSFGLGNSGNINIQAETIFLNNGAFVITSNSQGDAGNLTINASKSVQLVGSTGDGQLSSFLRTDTFGTGDAGDITINTGHLLIKDGASITARASGEGNAGDLTVNASESVQLIGSGAFQDSRIPSSLSTDSLVPENADDVMMPDDSVRQGNAGDITINTGHLLLKDGASISANANQEGKGGNLTVNASDSVQLIGSSTFRIRLDNDAFEERQLGSSLSTATSGIGQAGNLEINTRQLLVDDGANITTGTLGEGNAGNLTINASDSVQLTNTSGNSSLQSSLSTLTNGKGRSGDITINTGQLLVKDGAGISTGTTKNSEGDGGNLTVNASESVQLIGSGTFRIPLNDGTFREGQIRSALRSDTQGKGNAGDINVITEQLLVSDGAFISTSAEEGSEGNGGNLTVNASDSVQVIGASVLITGTIAKGRAGDLSITTRQLLLQDGGSISTLTTAEGEGGNLTINASDSIQLSGNFSVLQTSTDGKEDAGNINLTTRQLLVTDGAFISTDADEGSEGKAGNLTIDASESVQLIGTGTSPDGEFPSGLTTGTDGKGNAGNLSLTTRKLLLKDAAIIATATDGEGEGGNLTINASESVQLMGNTSDGEGSSVLLTSTFGKKDAGDLNLTTAQLLLQDGAEITTETQGSGNAGNLTINATESVRLSGVRVRDGKPTLITTETQGSGNAGILNVTTEQLLIEDGARISAATSSSSTGQGGTINLQTRSLTLNNNAQISAFSQGQNNAGNININAEDAIALTNSDITTSSDRASGGEINVTAKDIRLQGDSDIRTNVASGAGGGGDITLNADSILAYDDSDILAFARDGQGGNITLGTPVFFGSRFQTAPEDNDPDSLDGNNRVDINASGAVGGVISIPDLTFIQNNLSELPVNVINTEDLIANSCVVPNQKQAGTFIITGSGGLPVRPGDASISSYPTAEVRTISHDESSSNSWQIGDRIVEPQGVYRLSNGQLVMSRECSEQH